MKIMNKYNLIPKKFYHLVLEGTPYEIGQQIAEFIKGRGIDRAPHPEWP